MEKLRKMDIILSIIFQIIIFGGVAYFFAVKDTKMVLILSSLLMIYINIDRIMMKLENKFNGQ